MSKVGHSVRVPLNLEPCKHTSKLGSAQPSIKTLLTTGTSLSTIPVNEDAAELHFPVHDGIHFPPGPENASNRREGRCADIQLHPLDGDSSVEKDGLTKVAHLPKEIHLTPDMLEARVRTRTRETRLFSRRKESRLRLPIDNSKSAMSSDRCLTVSSRDTDRTPSPPTRNPSDEEITKEKRPEVSASRRVIKHAPQLPSEIAEAAPSRWETETDGKDRASRAPFRSPIQIATRAKSTGCIPENDCQSSFSGDSESGKFILQSPTKASRMLKARSAGQLTGRCQNMQPQGSIKVSPIKRLTMQELYTDAQSARFVVRSARRNNRRPSLSTEARSPVSSKVTLKSSMHSAPIQLETKRQSRRFSYESSDDDLSDSIRSGLSAAALTLKDIVANTSRSTPKISKDESRWGERSMLNRSDSLTDIYYSPPRNTSPSHVEPAVSETHSPGSSFRAPCTPPTNERRRTLLTKRGLSPVKGMRNLFRSFKLPSSPSDDPSLSNMDEESSDWPLDADDDSKSGVLVPDVLEIPHRGVDRNISELSNDEMFTLMKEAGVTDEIMDALLSAGLMITRGTIIG